MNKITQDYLRRYKEKRKEVLEMKHEIIERAKAVLIWENENLGCKHDINDKRMSCSFDVELDIDGVYLKVESLWLSVGKKQKIFVSYEKLFDEKMNGEELWQEK